MIGPHIIDHPQIEDDRDRDRPSSYIRCTNVGTWVAVYRGVLQGEFRGLGAEAKAARAAGTTRRIA